VSEARSINRAEILTARTDAAAEVAEAAAAEAAAAESAAVEAATAAAGGAAKAAGDTLGKRAALAPELPKESGGGAGGMAEDAEEIPGRPVFNVGAREKLKTRGGSLSSEGVIEAVHPERSTPTRVLRSLEYSDVLILNAITTLNFIIRVHLHGKRYTRIVQFPNHHQ
jgi:hypothetical protein